MSRIFSICLKDIKSFFYSISGYTLITIFLLLAGFFFSTAVSYYSLYSFQLSSQPYLAQGGLNLTEAVVGNLFFNLSVIVLLVIPVLTMRVIADEQRQGTFELLMTYPVSEFEIVMGKFFAMLLVFTLMLLPILLHLFLLKMAGGIFEWRVALSCFLGLFLLGMAFLTLGIFASSLTDNQMVSALLAFAFLLLLWIASWVSEFLPPFFVVWVNEISAIRHLEDFFKGVIEVKHIFYYVFFAFFFLLVTKWRLESRKWVR